MTSIITETSFPNLLHRGKVRDIYDLGDYLLMVATDRVSAFDVVLPNGIPDKGAVLAQLSDFWFGRTAHIVPNHLVAMGYEAKKLASLRLPTEVAEMPREVARRSMVVRKAQRVPIECVARGYISGSAWAEYRSAGTVNGQPMPLGLKESQQLPTPLFTPTTKAEQGHDLPLTFAQVESTVGAALARELRDKTLEVYEDARRYALTKGIIIADTKFEFGHIEGRLCLIDEALTPDSSRFWSAAEYQVGRSQDSLDKQIIRDWLLKIGWNKEPPAPRLPEDVVEKTARRYREVFEQLTGHKLR
ncbi:MAG: phosphoribosylaminoimidazolesuccinocarboxamide synthase [Chloroflexi bacterium]|nr:phosphoribosylaminoimidazolesuccinocarboxamide synthase [Chloroflexota bacterium]